MTQTQQTPAMVNWIGYLAIALLLLLPVSVLTVRSGAWQQGLLLYALSCLGCLLLFTLSGVLLALPRFVPFRRSILLRLLITVPGTVLLLSLLAGRGDYPPIHDITTDTDDPPIFTLAPEMRGEEANPLDIKPDSIAQQLAAYTDLQTLQTSLSPDEAFDRALRVAGELEWQVYHEDREAGIIEAVDTTRFMAFKDDVVIRIRSEEQGTAVDLRSVSRVGLGDLGANAKRIRAFLEAFQNQG